MPTFAGMVHDFLTPTPISFAEVEADRLTIRQGSWIFQAKSRDGFYYEGNYGERQVDPDRMLHCWLYPGVDGSKIVYTYWHHREDKSTQGESVFRLVPNTRPPGTLDELPGEWDLATRTLETQAHLTPGAPIKLVLIHDRIGKDEDGKPIDILFGALAMQNWSIRPIPDEERLDLSHYPDEFVEF